MTEENKKSLMKKTKNELIEIIARKDDTEQKYAGTVKELEANVAELSDELTLKLNVIKSYEEGNGEFGKECEKLKKEVLQLRTKNTELENYKKEAYQRIQTLNSNLITTKEDKEDLQVKCAEWEANYDEIYCESNKYKGISRILTVISVALLGAVMIMMF